MPSPKPLSAFFAQAIAAQHKAGRYRTLESNSDVQGRRVIIEQRQFVNFCSNDYLGLSNHPDVKFAAAEAIKKYGVGSGAAALLSGRHRVHEDLENQLAEFTGYESALLFSSGYLANLGLITALASRHDVIHHDKLNHASLIDAVNLTKATSKRYPHNDIERLSTNLQNTPGERHWIVTDGVFSMDGDIAPLPNIAKLAAKHEATLIVDDAHGFGVLANGRGSVAHYNLNPDDIPISVVTFGKSLGSAGAAVLGSRDLIEYLIQVSRTFIYDTALPPAIAAAAIESLTLIENDPAIVSQLKENIKLFRTCCKNLAIPVSDSVTPIQSIVLGAEDKTLRIAEKLKARGFYLRAVRPPTVPVGTSRLRICISSGHHASDIETFSAALAETLVDE